MTTWMRANRGNTLTRHAVARTARFDTCGKEAETGTEWIVARCGSKLAGSRWREGDTINDMSRLTACRRCTEAIDRRERSLSRTDPR